MTLDNQLRALISTARREVLLVAPFITLAPARRMFGCIPPEVRHVTVVTRWRTDEVAAGVSDLAVLDIVEARPGARLLLNNRLHAKMYRADERCLVGSANLTDLALGIADHPNLEILVSCDDQAAIEQFTKTLLGGCYSATAAIRDAIAAAAAACPAPASPPRPWLPACSSPHELWRVYSGQDLSRVLKTSIDHGRSDIAALSLAPGLDEASFKQAVTSRFLGMPVVSRFLDRFDGGLGDQEAIQMLREEVPEDQTPHADTEVAWEVLKRWLKEFGPFRSRATGEEIVRGRQL